MSYIITQANIMQNLPTDCRHIPNNAKRQKERTRTEEASYFQTANNNGNHKILPFIQFGGQFDVLALHSEDKDRGRTIFPDSQKQ